MTRTISLRVCKSVSMHKLKGVSICLGKYLFAVVFTLPDMHTNTQPGMELVALSKVAPKESFFHTVNYDVNGVTVEG